MPGAENDIEESENELKSSEIEETVAYYSRVVEHRLKPDLDLACKQRDKAFEQLAELDQLSKSLHMLDSASAEATRFVDRSDSHAVETLVNLGQEVYAHAVVDDVDRLIMDVGLGVMVELSRDEVRKFSEQRKEMLENTSERMTKRITTVQAHLKSVVHSLSKFKASATELALAKAGDSGDQ